MLLRLFFIILLLFVFLLSLIVFSFYPLEDILEIHNLFALVLLNISFIIYIPSVSDLSL